MCACVGTLPPVQILCSIHVLVVDQVDPSPDIIVLYTGACGGPTVQISLCCIKEVLQEGPQDIT